jgi:hypothetical protein
MPIDDSSKKLSDSGLAKSEFVRRVGFLRRGESFDAGDVDENVFERLCELTQNPWQPWACAGIHHCDLCRFTGNSVGTYYKRRPGGIVGPGYPVSAASSTVDLWVPGDGFLWVCPTNVTHYIDAHSFCPPSEFCEAVLRCPPLRSMDYLKAVLANGGRKLGFGSMNPRPGPPTP